MKNTIKTGFVIMMVMGAASGARAAYSGDLLVGFTLQNGNDLVYDLGLASDLTYGESWNLGSLLDSANASQTSPFSLNDPNVQWGVIGSLNVNGTRTSWATKGSSDFSPPPQISGNTQWATAIDINITSVAAGIGVATTSSPGAYGSVTGSAVNSWSRETVSTSSPPINYRVGYMNPNSTGYTTAVFWRNTADNTPGTAIGVFNFDNTGTLTYESILLMPEPSSHGLFAAAGVLLVGLHNQFRRKQA
jgi:hypothetical protein